jgi:hypothetical protein
MNHAKPRYRLHEAFDLLGLARSVGYVRMREGKLRAVYDGRRAYITADEIDRYVAGRPHATAQAPELSIISTDAATSAN